MDWMNQDANAGGYDPNTAPVNLSPFANRAAGVAGDVLGQGFNQIAAFGGGALGVNHAFSNTPVYDKLVRQPAGDNSVVAPNFAQRAGAVGYDVLSAIPRLFKSAGHYLDPAEVGAAGSYTPAYDVIRGLDAKVAAGPVAAAAASPADPVAATAANPNITMLKSKVVPMEQAMARMNPSAQAGVDPNASTGIPLGTLMKLAAVANQRKVISARDQIMGAVYGWHHAAYMDAYNKLQANPNDKAAQDQMQKAREGATTLVSNAALGQQMMFGQQEP